MKVAPPIHMITYQPAKHASRKPAAINITNYFFTPRDFFFALKYIIFNFTLRDGFGILCIVEFSVIMRMLFELDTTSIFFILYILCLFYWRISARFSFGSGLICLILIPIFTILSDQLIIPEAVAWAQTVAVWAFYFLAIGVIKTFFEYFVEEHHIRKQENALKDLQDIVKKIREEYEI